MIRCTVFLGEFGRVGRVAEQSRDRSEERAKKRKEVVSDGRRRRGKLLFDWAGEARRHHLSYIILFYTLFEYRTRSHHHYLF